MRTLKNTFAFLMVGAVLILFAGCANKTFLSVNEQKVRKDEFNSRLEKVPVQTRNGTQLAGQYVVEQLINEKIILDFAKNKGVFPTKDQIAKKIEFITKQNPGGLQKLLQAQGMTKEELEKKIEVEQALVNVVTKGVNVSDSDVKKAYDQALKAPNSPFKRPEQVNISVIVGKTKAKIAKAYSELQKGVDFNSTAQSLSDDPTGKMTKGQIGWVSKGMKGLPSLIANAAFAQSPNAYTSPVQTGKSEWVIVKTHQKRPAKTTQYDEVKDAIKEQIALQKGNQAGAFKEDLKKFIKSSDIKVNSSKYKNIVDMIKKQSEAPITGATAQPGK